MSSSAASPNLPPRCCDRIALAGPRLDIPADSGRRLRDVRVGIAMGTGTEVAIQSAGITLVKGDLAGIARARALSRATMRNIRQNLAVTPTLGW